MRIVIQRVKQASVSVDQKIVGQISHGMLVLLGIENRDNESDIDYIVKKLKGLRIFNDEEGKMNLNIESVKGSFLVVSQFTLLASTKKGNRPSYTRSASPNIAQQLYEKFIVKLKGETQLDVASGVFGADMQVCLNNDGPVTIVMDSQAKEF